LTATRDDGIVVVGVKKDAMAAAPMLMTAREYYATPETVLPTELAFGVLQVHDAPSARHQSAVLRLVLALNRHVEAQRLGQVWVAPLDVVLDEAKALIVQPDVLFISNARANIVRERVHGAPDLVIEILSPNPRVGRTAEHMRWFAEYGVRECWLVHQDQQRLSVIEFHDRAARPPRIFGARERIQSSVLPDLELSLHDILSR
jgi:Uma2 family endonuclease